MQIILILLQTGASSLTPRLFWQKARGKGAVYLEVEPFYPAEIKPINARQNEV